MRTGKGLRFLGSYERIEARGMITSGRKACSISINMSKQSQEIQDGFMIFFFNNANENIKMTLRLLKHMHA